MRKRGLIILMVLIAMAAGGVFFQLSKKSIQPEKYNPPYAKIKSDKIILGQIIIGEKSIARAAEKEVGVGLGVKKDDEEIILTPILLEAKKNIAPERDGNRMIYREVYPGVDVEYLFYDGHVKENIIIKNEQAQRRFIFDLKKDFPKSKKIGVKTDDGSFVFVFDEETGEELFTLDYPIGYDASGYPMPYHYIIEGEKLILEIHDQKDWQRKVKYPVVVDPPMSVREYDEVLVKIGQNGEEAANAKDGDVVMIKPKGWRWGKMEKRDFVMVRVPKLTEKERLKYMGRQDSCAAKINENGLAEMMDENDDWCRTQNELAGIVYYGIDYTRLSQDERIRVLSLDKDSAETEVDRKNVLAVLRDRGQDNPILDASKLKLEEIFKAKRLLTWIEKKETDKIVAFKNNLKNESVISVDERLAKRVQEKKTYLAKVFDKIIEPVRAATTNTYTIGTGSCDGSCDYSTISAWEDARDGNLTGNDYVEVGECYNDGTMNNTVLIDGSTTDATRYMQLTVAIGERHDGTAGTGFKIDPSASDQVVEIKDDYTIVEWLEITGVPVNSYAFLPAVLVSNPDSGFTDGVIVRNNIIHDFDTNGDTDIYAVYVGFMSGSVPNKIYNNIIYDLGGGVVYRAHGIAAVDDNMIYNNLVYKINAASTDDNFWIYSNNGTDVRNNVAFGCTDMCYRVANTPSASSGYNISSDASYVSAANDITSATIDATNDVVSITDGEEDFHIKGTDSDLYDDGADLSGVFSTDIDNDTRTRWDIGPDEYEAPAEPPVEEGGPGARVKGQIKIQGRMKVH